MADYEKPLIHVVDASGNKIPATVAMLTSGGGGGGGGGDASAANQVTGNTSLASIDGKTPALGQALASGSVPVVLPAAQITALTPPTSVGISGTLPLPSGLTVTATRLLTDGSGVTQPVSIATLPALATGTNNIGSITNITGTVSLPTGAATSANQSTSNASLASIDGKLPVSLGAKASSASLAVAPAFAATSTLTNVASSATSVTVLAANNNRKTVIIVNDSTSDLYIAWSSSAASTTNYSIFLAGKVGNTPSFTSFSGEDYSGEVRGIWISANGSARITETS